MDGGGIDLIGYLGSLPPAQLDPLYDSTFTCLAVLRSLPPLARQYATRLLYAGDGVPAALVASWPRPDAASTHEAALETLRRLRLLEAAGPGGAAYALAPAFAVRVSDAVAAGLAPLLHAASPAAAAAAPPQAALDAHADAAWESLLLFLVGSAVEPPPPPPELAGAPPLDVRALLVGAGLAAREPGSGHAVTRAGFQFLLADTYGQLWAVLRQYVAGAEAAPGGALAAAVSFLLQLGFQRAAPLRAAALAPAERAIAAHMAQLGLLLPFRAGGEAWLSPTRLAVATAGGAGAAAAAAAADGFVIVETNFRVYAYTASPVRQAVLRLFARCDALLPNVFVGTVTRESVGAALDAGIGAEQVVGYLRQHAHERAAARSPSVPGVVADQIRLWERETKRVLIVPAVLYRNWESGELYRRASASAAAAGARLLADDEGRALVAAAGAHDAVRAEIKAAKLELKL
jgi:transcription initiation factor TFIIH subunit 4